MNISKAIPYKKSLLLAAAVAAGFAFFGQGIFQKNAGPADQGTAIALDWNCFMLMAETYTEGWRGPVASRAYGYVGLAAYEAALPGLPNEFLSLETYFPGLELPPVPTGEFLPEAALNTCYATILGKFFLSAPRSVEQERLKLEQKWEKKCAVETTGTEALHHSREFGRKVALAVFEWSATDSLGHLAHLHNYDRHYSTPKGEGKWVPCADFPMPPLLPYWGEVRPFVINTREHLAKPMPTFSTEPNSPYYTQALEVLTLNSPLSEENQWIAEYWSDDHPGLTFTPPGRWISIANQVVAQEAPPVGKTLETYLKTGIALADASIASWYSKYHFNLERPETYIARVFDPSWRPFHHTPPFPSYPSGHAMLGAAAAEVLTQLYGDHFELLDRSHEGRKEFKGMPRRYHSFYEMSTENSLSRILLGVHFRMDCEEGLRLGSLIGKEALNLKMRQGLTSGTGKAVPGLRIKGCNKNGTEGLAVKGK